MDDNKSHNRFNLRRWLRFSIAKLLSYPQVSFKLEINAHVVNYPPRLTKKQDTSKISLHWIKFPLRLAISHPTGRLIISEYLVIESSVMLPNGWTFDATQQVSILLLLSNGQYLKSIRTVPKSFWWIAITSLKIELSHSYRWPSCLLLQKHKNRNLSLSCLHFCIWRAMDSL